MNCYGIKIPTPYKGLIPYSQTDNLFFFGREKEQQIVLQNLRTSRLTVLYGASGVGKSSLLRAGVAYHLRQAALENLEATRKPGWGAIVFPPLKGELNDNLSWHDPLTGIKKQLESEIINLFKNESPNEIKQQFEQVIKTITKNQEQPSLTDIFKAWIEIVRQEDGSSRLFIILDQFEEYFDLYNRTQDTFTDEFSQAVNNSRMNIHFLISIREDALAKLDHFKGHIFHDLLDNRLAIKHLNYQAAQEAIEKPIAEYQRQQVIIDNLCNSKLTVIYGDSSAGKTKILRNGIACYLHQAAERNLREYGKPKFAFTLFNSWHQDKLLDSLLLQMQQSIEDICNIQAPPSDLGLTETLQVWTTHINIGSNGTFFIILDQFEEYLLRHPQADKQDPLLVEIFQTLNHPELDVHFLICIHDTKVNDLKSIIQKSRLNCPSQYLHLYPNDVNLDIADNLSVSTILPPEKNKSISIEPELIKTVLDDIKSENYPVESQSEEIFATPYLQLLMLRLWQEEMIGESPTYRLQMQSYIKLGKAEKIVQEHLDQKLENINNDFKINTSYRLFYYLVTPSGDKLTLKAKDLYDYVNAETNHLEKLNLEIVQRWLDKLSEGEARILRPLAANRYEIFLDVLVKAISKRLQHQRKVKEIEQIAKDTLQQFEFSELEALLAVMQAGQELQKIKDELIPKNYQAHQLKATLQTVLDHIREQHHFLAHNKQIWSVNFSPDGQYIVTGSEDGTARLWDLQGKHLQEFKDDNDCNWFWSVSFSPDSKYLASGSTDGKVRLWDLAGNLINQFPAHKDWVWSVSFSPDGQYLASGCVDGTASLWDLKGSLMEEPLKAQEGWVWSVSFSPDSQYLAIALSKDTVYLWNLKDHSQRKFSVSGAILHKISVSPSGHQLATASSDGKARLWDLQGNLLQEFTGHQGWVYSVSFSPDGQYLATASSDSTARLWNLQGNQLAELRGHKGWVRDVSFSPNGKKLVTASSNGMIHIWNIESAKFAKFTGHKGWVWDIAFSPDGQFLATASPSDKTVRLWDLEGNQLNLFNLVIPVVIATFSRDIQKFATSSEDSNVYLWDLQGNLLAEFKGHTSWVWSIKFSLDGKYLATASSDGTARLWNLQGRPLQTFSHHNYLWSVSFSPKGQLLATGSDSAAYLWNLQGQLLQKFHHKGWIWSIAFSPDGHLLATASSEGTACLWDLEGNLVQEFTSHKGWIWSINFSPDGEYLATGSSDGKAYLWDLEGNLVQEFAGFQGAVYCVSFSPNGKQIATASADGNVKLWPIETVNSLLERGNSWLKDY